jgi:hypothetical protein
MSAGFSVQLSPEWKFLLACARTGLREEELQTVTALIADGLDWNCVAKTSFNHGVTPLVYHSLCRSRPSTSRLKNAGTEVIPREFLVQLQNQFYANTAHNLYLTEHLLGLLNLFKQHGISALPFKGPVLAASAYGNLALREFSDLDILIRKRDLSAVKEILTSKGYRAGIQSHWECHFLAEEPGVMIDLHWAIMPSYFPFALDIDGLWDRLESISLNGRMVPSLSPPDLLLTLCVHGSKHLWERLAWICDVAELVRSSESVDWTPAMEEAGRLGVERMVALGLFLANDLLGARLSDDILRRIQGYAAVKSLAGRIRERLFLETRSRFGTIKKSFFYLKMRERWSDKARYSFSLLRPFWPVVAYNPVKRFLSS